MSKRDGTLFSSALFGYKKSDVNDYIRRSDISYDDQLSLLRSENDRLLERAQKAEAKVEELEALLKHAESELSAQIDRLTKELDDCRKTASGSLKNADTASTKGTSRPVKLDSARPSSQKRTNIFGTVKKK